MAALPDQHKKKKRKKKHFKDEKKHGNKKRQELHQYSQATLGAGNMRVAVKCPNGEDLNEWLAANTVDFFNEVSLLYGIVTEYCTNVTCPVMSAGPKYEYLWADGKKIKKPIKCTAPEYIDYLMTWVEDQINDPKIFPIQDDEQFPVKFREVHVSQILKRLLRVYGHIYHHHLSKFREMDAEAHLNTCFKHLIYFVKEFELVSNNELAPLKNAMEDIIYKKNKNKPMKYKPTYAPAAVKPQ